LGADSGVSLWSLGKARGRTLIGAAPRATQAAVALGIAYALALRVGLSLRASPEGTPLLSPASAILTATLLLTSSPRRRWVAPLAVALPAHLVMCLGTGWPLPVVLTLFGINWCEALAAVALLRLLGGSPPRFETLRGVAVFMIAAVLLAPLASSCLYAAAEVALRSGTFWSGWRNGFASSSLGELTLVPGIVMLLAEGAAVRRWTRPQRVMEAVLLLVATSVVGFVAFACLPERLESVLGPSVHPVALLLLPLLWGTMRFGPAGASFTLLLTALIAVWAAIQRVGLFSHAPAMEAAVILESVAWVVGVLLLCLAAILREREANERLLQERLRFEALLSEFSGAFVHLPSDEMDAALGGWLARLGRALGVDGVFVSRAREDGTRALTRSWVAPGTDPSAWHEARGSARLDLQLVAAGRVLGLLSFVRQRKEPGWPEELIHRLSLVADVLASVLARKDTEDALRATEAMKSAILASLPTGVAVLDHQGWIVAVSEAWKRLAQENPSGPQGGVREGENYVDAWREAAAHGSAEAREVVAGILGVLDASRAQFTGERAWTAEGQEHLLAVSVVPLPPRMGAIVCHTDVSERRRAEAAAQTSRRELAHFLRVSTAGVMTTSLAHELNQPLTAILANAQAAQELLKRQPPDIAEIGEILGDLVEQDKHAGEVIGRLRNLGRTDAAPTHVALDLASVLQDVIRILGRDCLARKVTIRSYFEANLPLVAADRTQVQQVVLNLLTNAIDAVGAQEGCEGAITVRVRAVTPAGVEVSVCDTGVGLPPGVEEDVFEPFFTTKPGGMGLGLSIARSIISAHGGRIWAQSTPGGGGDFRFVLPASAP
jgi:signal transduction histidine kinase/integral membrane sensor domain MASE1